MAVKLKANITYQPIVESVSRKFVPKKETCSAGVEAGPVVTMAAGWMGGAVRTSGRGGLGACSKNYLVIRSNARQSEASAAELENRVLFQVARAGAQTCLMDVSQVTNIQQLYKAASEDKNKVINGVSAYGYTYRGWVFAVQHAGKKASEEYNVNRFPTAFDA